MLIGQKKIKMADTKFQKIIPLVGFVGLIGFVTFVHLRSRKKNKDLHPTKLVIIFSGKRKSGKV